MGILLYQLELSQGIEIKEFIGIEMVVGNILTRSTCKLDIRNQCEVRGEEYSGRSVGILNEMNGQMDNMESIGRVSFGLGIIFIIYSSYRELSKIKQNLLN